MITPLEVKDISGGISFYPKRPNKAFQVAWMRSIDYRTDPNKWQLLPATVRESGTVIDDLVTWMERAIPRTDIPPTTTNLITNSSFETNTTGWSLDADYTRSNTDAYDGSYSIKQVSTSGFSNFYTGSSGIAVDANSDYIITFRAKVTVTSGFAPLFQVNVGSAFGTTLDGSFKTISATGGEWVEQTATINTGGNTTIWLRIFNNDGAVTAYYDQFSIIKIPQTSTFLYDQSGNIYRRTPTGTYGKVHTAPQSHGNGLIYFAEDDYLYYMRDKAIGRYGTLSGSSQLWVDDFLQSEGGIPTNTHALAVASASSQYASKTDTASLSITGNLSAEIYYKPTSLPASGSSQVFMSKWDESGTTRSYRFEIYGVSGYFEGGDDGDLTIAADTTDTPIDSACSGTINTNTLFATNASFAVGQVILIHQTQGTDHGTRQRTKITGYTAGQITTEDQLNYSYSSTGTNKAQVMVLKRYNNVTINTGKTLTAKAWNGTTGGIIGFVYSGTYTNNGTITATGKGFRGGTGGTRSSDTTTAGESYMGTTTAKTVNYGGGGNTGVHSGGSGSGSGGSYQTAGTDGGGGVTGQYGATYGSPTLVTVDFGSGGGGGYEDGGGVIGGAGGAGGGLVYIEGANCTTGIITAQGAVGTASTTYSGGSGAGGAIIINGQTITWSAGVSAAGGAASGGGSAGGAGGNGAIHTNYLLSIISGTTTPTYTSTQDDSLVTTTVYNMRLGISSTGSNSEYLTKRITTPVLGIHKRFGVAWTASTSTATFYVDGINLGTSVGTLTAIHDNASVFILGGYKDGTGTVTGFLNGIVDDARLFNTVRTDAQMLNNKDVEIATTTTGLAAYYKLNNNYNDSTANANNLTSSGSPVFTTDVPFANPTTRLDIDQSASSTGNTFTLGTSISETDLKTFVPAKDPQKSLSVYVDTVGTGDWTLTVHDALNRTVATATVANASVIAGELEFVFTNAWRPVVGATYHFHVTVSTGTSKVVTGTASDFTTAKFTSYYQFLVSDDVSHAATQMLNFIAICNERYLAKLQAGPIYEPMKLTLPAGYRSRCLGKWNEYLAIGVYKGANVYDYDQGYIFFWDGTSTTYNFYIPVPEGAVNAMYGSGGTLYFIAGYQGDVLAYTGGDRAKKLFRLPKMTMDKYVEVLPAAMNMWESLLRIGYGVSDSSVMERGVYTYGHLNDGDQDSLSYDFPISTGTRTASTVKIGCVYPIDKKLLVSWQDSTAYGVDIVDPTGDPYQTGTIELMVFDNGAVFAGNQIQIARADFEALSAGQTVTLKYKRDNETTWSQGTATTSSSDHTDYSRFNIPSTSSRNAQHQVAVDIATTTDTSPKILSITTGFNDLSSEQQI